MAKWVWLRQLGYGALSSYQDYRAMFTWRSWSCGWLLRLLCQVLFFATLGRLVGSAGAEEYMAVGNAAILAPLGALGVVSSTLGERRSGTLQFLLISRANPHLVLASRGLHWLADGVITATIALMAVPALVDVHIAFGRLPLAFLLLLLMASSTYQLALSLTGVSLRWPGSRTYLTAGVGILLMLAGGVNTPTPRSGLLGALAHLLPAVNAIPALRALLGGESVPLGGIYLELAVAVGWGLAAHSILTWSLRRGVDRGTIDLP
ncbi:hypothetical protein [Pilimelia columellifera]|uniref:ABC-2 type transporter domain-containing protein n=1 Tax=Pilimelia columellifera subsp. columellifera TaxID=706583 RepID=A0ABP6B3L7_9ACTN